MRIFLSSYNSLTCRSKFHVSCTYWQENASRKPPPPGTAPAEDPDVSVMIVPAATVLAAVAVHVEPAAAAVVQLMMVLPGVQMFEVVEGVTVIKNQVVLTPEYERIFMLGVQAAGAGTETRPFNVICCAGPAGLFQAAVPVCPP
jgi:hypothetical protein